MALQDMSLENLLLFVTETGAYNVKICDPGQVRNLVGMVGTGEGTALVLRPRETLTAIQFPFYKVADYHIEFRSVVRVK